jgi:hypothetical protein
VLMYIVSIWLMVYYWNTIDGKLTNVIPPINGSKITIRMAIGETHLENLKMNSASCQGLRRVYVWTMIADGGV